MAPIVAVSSPVGVRGGLYLFALDDHVQEVRRDASPLEPLLAPVRDGERVELAEVSGPFDRCTGQAELGGLGIVMDAGMPAVLLVGQHLHRRTERPDERPVVSPADLGLERHPLIVADPPSLHCTAACDMVVDSLSSDNRMLGEL